MRIWIVIGAVILLAAGCSGQAEQVRPAPGTAPEAAPPREAPARQVEVVFNDFKFMPDRLEVAAGKIKLTFKNQGTVEHTFVLPDLGKGSPPVQPGQEFEIEVSFQPGEYAFECDIPGHKEAGMAGTLTVR